MRSVSRSFQRGRAGAPVSCCPLPQRLKQKILVRLLQMLSLIINHLEKKQNGRTTCSLNLFKVFGRTLHAAAQLHLFCWNEVKEWKKERIHHHCKSRSRSPALGRLSAGSGWNTEGRCRWKPNKSGWKGNRCESVEYKNYLFLLFEDVRSREWWVLARHIGDGCPRGRRGKILHFLFPCSPSATGGICVRDSGRCS